MAMMNRRRLFFVFLLSIFIKFVFSTPSSSEEFADECDKIEKEITRIPKAKHRPELVERLAKARLELAAKDKQMKEELAAKDREIGAVISEKKPTWYQNVSRSNVSTENSNSFFNFPAPV